MQQNNRQLSIRKPIVVIIGILIVLAAGQWLISYLTTGKIIITTDSKYNDVSISSVSHSTTAKKGFSKHSKGSLITKLKAGDYFVSVQNGVNGSTQYVKIKGHSTTHLDIHLMKTTGVEPVAYVSAQNIIADSTRLRYLDPEDGSINQINRQNQESETSVSYNLVSVKWVDTSYGVGQNAAGQLFVVDGDTISPLNSPISGKDDTGAVYDISPNGTIYIGLGSSVYRGSEKKSFKKIYADMPSRSVLVASNDKVAVLTNGYTGNKPEVSVIDQDGKRHNKTLNGFLNGWSSWSKDGKYFVIVEGAKGDVFDSSLNQVATIPQSNVVYADWSANDTLLYSVGSQLWSYNINLQKSQLIANMPLNSSIKSISVGTDSSYVYLVSQSDNSDNETQAIRRIGLKSQSVPEYIYQLQSTTPVQLGSYSISIINFSFPATIVVQPYPGSPAGDYIGQARSTLSQDGFNPNDFRYQIVPLEP